MKSALRASPRPTSLMPRTLAWMSLVPSSGSHLPTVETRYAPTKVQRWKRQSSPTIRCPLSPNHSHVSGCPTSPNHSQLARSTGVLRVAQVSDHRFLAERLSGRHRAERAGRRHASLDQPQGPRTDPDSSTADGAGHLNAIGVRSRLLHQFFFTTSPFEL